MTKILTVIGATGSQGGSVVDTALKAGTYKVRAITRNVNSEKANALAARGVEVVAADLNDVKSLTEAFHGSSAIFAVTNFFEPFATGGPETALKVEVAQGKNLADAAANTPTLEHFVWSTLPNGLKISKGKYLVPHFEGKNKIDEYIKSIAALHAKTTFLWVAFYAHNYLFPMYTPNLLKTSGKYVQLQPTPPTVPIQSIGDASKNVGIFVRAILASPKLTLGGKFVLASIEETTSGELLKTWSKATGREAVYVQVPSLEEYDSIWPMWGQEIGVMMKFWEEAGDKSWSGESGILTLKDLGIKDEFVGNEQAFKSIDWS